MQLTCPLCKNSAKVSSTYPTIVVCKCSGKLEEVGNIVSGVFQPKTVQNVQSDTTLSSMIVTIDNENYAIKQLFLHQEMIEIGEEMNNALSSQSYLDYCVGFKKSYEEIYVVYKINEPNNTDKKIVFAVTEGKAINFRKKNNQSPKEYVTEIITKKLRENQIIK